MLEKPKHVTLIKILRIFLLLHRFGLLVAMSVYIFIFIFVYLYGQESPGWIYLFKLVTFLCENILKPQFFLVKLIGQ